MPTQEPPHCLGAKVKALRASRGWTLVQLSARAGLTPSTISKIERSRLSPTYPNLARLARGLGVDVSQLFSEDEEESFDLNRFSVMRIDDGELIQTSNYCHYYLHTNVPTRSMTPIVVDITAYSLDQFGPLITHFGQEFTYVLSGIVEVHVSGHAPQTLKAGDSIYFDSSLPHAYLAASRGPCRVLSVCSDIDDAALSELFADK